MNIWIGTLKVNSVSFASSINTGTNLNIKPYSSSKNQVGTSTFGDCSVVSTKNPIFDPDGVDNPAKVTVY